MSVLQLAVHEAAHVVVAHVLGIAVEAVRLESRDGRRRGWTKMPAGWGKRPRAYLVPRAGEFYERLHFDVPEGHCSLQDRLADATFAHEPGYEPGVAILAAMLTRPEIERAIWRVAVELLDRKELGAAEVKALLQDIPSLRRTYRRTDGP